MSEQCECRSTTTCDSPRSVVARELEPSPVVASPRLGERIVLKLETLQPTGSFKVRGGLVAMAQAAEDGVAVVAASAGNHGLGVAYGAARFGVPATVVVPENASPQEGARARAVRLHARAPRPELRRSRTARARAGGGRPRRCGSCRRTTIRSRSPGSRRSRSNCSSRFPTCRGSWCPSAAADSSPASRSVSSSEARTDVEVVGVVAAASPAMLRAYEVGSRRGGRSRRRHWPTVSPATSNRRTITVDIVREHVAAIVEVSEEAIGGGMRYLAFEHGIVERRLGRGRCRRCADRTRRAARATAPRPCSSPDATSHRRHCAAVLSG